MRCVLLFVCLCCILFEKFNDTARPYVVPKKNKKKRACVGMRECVGYGKIESKFNKRLTTENIHAFDCALSLFLLLIIIISWIPFRKFLRNFSSLLPHGRYIRILNFRNSLPAHRVDCVFLDKLSRKNRFDSSSTAASAAISHKL